MRIYHNQLNQHLATPLANVWLVFGDEPWQKQNAIERIQQCAYQQGFIEKITLTADDQFKWQQLVDEYQAMSLFASQRVITVELIGKISESARKLLEDLAQILHQDIVLIIHGGKLDSATANKKWFKQLNQQGVYLPVYELDTKGLSRWLFSQAKHYQLKLSHDVSEILISLFEGNLLALDQELQKFSLLFNQQSISVDDVLNLTVKQAKFNPFQLTDTLLTGNVSKCLSMLEQLKQEGSASGQLIWFLHKELTTLEQMLTEQAQGQNFAQLCKTYRIWRNKEALYKKALSTVKLPQVRLAKSRLAQVDLLSKTSSDFDDFILLADICIALYHPEKMSQFKLDYDYL